MHQHQSSARWRAAQPHACVAVAERIQDGTGVYDRAGAAVVKVAHRMTLVLVSHDMDVIGHMCVRAAVMRSGGIERLL